VHPDATLESWDEIQFLAFREPWGTNPNRVVGNKPRQRRAEGADLARALTYVGDSLDDNQGFFYQDRPDKYRLIFPYAWFVKVGDKVKNTTTDAEYTVQDILVNGPPAPYGPGYEVVLSGGRKPAASDRLRLHPSNTIDYFHSYPKANAEPYKFDDQGTLKSTTRAWNDTITFMVMRREPGSSSPNPFGDGKIYKPRYIESELDRLNPDTISANYFMLWESLVQFDCWAQTNERADRLLHWFEDFIFRYAPVWEFNGVIEILPWRVDQDRTTTRWRNDIVSRSVIYYFRTQTVYSARSRRLAAIEIAADVGTQLESDTSQIAEDAYEGDVIEYPPIPTIGYSGPEVILSDGSGPLTFL